MTSELPSSPSSITTGDRLDFPVGTELNETGETTNRRAADKWKTRVSQQGPWDQTCTPKMLSGTPALPMPIQVSAPSSLAPFFDHLECNGSTLMLSDMLEKQYPGVSQVKMGKEPTYDIPSLNMKRVLYTLIDAWIFARWAWVHSISAL